MSNNTAIQKMKQLKKILRMAVEEGYIKASPFKMTLKKEQKDVDPLTLEEVRKIRNKKISIERLAKVRDMFIFECYTGLAFTDMVNLEHVVAGRGGQVGSISFHDRIDFTAIVVNGGILLRYRRKRCRHSQHCKE